MRAQHQTIFGAGKGNCFATCIACVLELPVEAVPNFCGDYWTEDGEWFRQTNKWLAQHGLRYIEFSFGEWLGHDHGLPDVYVIVSGPGPRGCNHATVWRGELLERPGTVVLSDVVEPAAPTVADEAEPVAEAEAEPAPAVTHARVTVRTQVDIEEIVLDLLRLQPDIGMDQLAALAYGEGDKRARTKLTWTLKGMAQRGQVERLSATTWRVLAAEERDDREDDDESDDTGDEADAD